MWRELQGNVAAVEKAPLPRGVGGGNVVVKVTETEKGNR